MSRTSRFLAIALLGPLQVVVSGPVAADPPAAPTASDDDPRQPMSIRSASETELLHPLRQRWSWLSTERAREELGPERWRQEIRSEIRRLDLVRSSAVRNGEPSEYLEGELLRLEADLLSLIENGPFTVAAFVEGGGAILGRVTDTLTGLGIENADVDVFDVDDHWVDGGRSGLEGYYSVGGLPPGEYIVRARKNGYVTEVWNDQVCHPYCKPYGGDAILVGLGAAVSGIDFVLEPTGAISGRVESAFNGEDIDADIVVARADGSVYDVESATGDFTLPDVAPGTYYVYTTAAGYYDELFDDVPCEAGPPIGCELTDGTPLTITPGQSTTGIDFSLEQPFTGAITGTIFDAETGLPADDVFTAYLYDNNGLQVERLLFVHDQYRFEGLDTGQYYVWLESDGGYSSELWDDITCEDPCDPTTGTQVIVTNGETTAGIDFTLDPPGRVEGSVIDEHGVPLAEVRVYLSSPGGGSDWTDLKGQFHFDEVKPGVDHFAWVESYSHLDELFDDIPCEPPPCDPSGGSPIVVAPSQTVSDVTFELSESPRITGTVTWSATGTLLRAFVYLIDPVGNVVASTQSNGKGLYLFTDLQPGLYTLAAFASLFVGELYDDIPCRPADCDFTAGTPVVIKAGDRFTADFALDRTARIAGHVVDGVSGDQMVGCSLSLYDEPGIYLNGTTTGPDGSFVFDRLQAGSYRVQAHDCAGREGRVWEDVYCPSNQCDLLQGTLVPGKLNSITDGIDFSLGPLILFIDGFETGDLSAWSSASP